MPESETHHTALGGGIRYAHYHRYAFACEQIAGLNVLDVACGKGDGSAILAGSAMRVQAIDPDAQLIAAANLKYAKPGKLEYAVGQVTALPYPDRSFDAVVSFETIGGGQDPALIALEIRRVLKPGGFAIVSVPVKIGSDLGVSGASLTSEKAVQLLRQVFQHVTIFGQRMVIASSISPIDQHDNNRNVAEYRGYTALESDESTPTAPPAITRLASPDGLVFMAGDGPLPTPSGADSIFLMEDQDLWAEHAKAVEMASKLHRESESLHDIRKSHAREIERLSTQTPHTDLGALGPMLEEISGTPVAPDLPNLIRMLSRLAVERATQNVRLADFETTKASARAMTALLENTRGKLQQAEIRLVDQMEALRRANAELQAVTLRAQNGDRQVDDLRVEVEAIANRLQTTDRARSEAQAKADEYHVEISEMGRRFSEVQADLDAARQSIEQMEFDHVQTAETQNRASQSAISSQALLEKQIQSIQSGAESLAEALTATEADLKAVRSKLSEASLELQSLRDEAKAHDTDIEALNRTINDRDSELETLKAQLRPTSERRTVSDQSHPTRATASGAQALSAPAAQNPPVAGELRQVQNAYFSQTLRARRGDAALNAVKSLRTSQEAVTSVRRLQSDLNDTLRRAASKVAAAGLPSAANISAAASPPQQKANPRSLKGKALAALRGQARVHEKRRDPRLSDALLKTLFDADHYVRTNKLTLALGQSALDHYFAEGRQAGLATHPLIDLDWLARTRPNNVEGRFDLVEYLVDPSLFSYSPHPLFDAEYYLLTNQDVLRANANPLAHYMLYGWKEGRAPNPVFNSAWYLGNNEDVMRSGINPLVHYAQFGAAEGRDAHPLFDRAFYLRRNPDVASSGMDPYGHFIAYGRAEGRLPGQIAEQAQRFNDQFNSTDAVNLLVGADPSERLKPIIGFWPPSWDGQYWLPQTLRDLIISRYGIEKLDLYIYLFSVIERYADAPGSFDDSEDCRNLIDRAKVLAKSVSDARPTASIIIPVYNNLLYTLTCIVSVLEIDHRYSFEIIIGDDVSSDKTREAMEEIGGIVRNHRNKTNLGFLLNCNSAAETARGDYLVFLNNDVIVMPGWLDNLLSPFETHSKIGFVGSKLLNGDGTLQEAGGVFWKDGSAWNFGRNSDASLPEFNYLKDTDYVSGASIAIPSRLWSELEGFDPTFVPAYCEDSDIAFRIRKAGYRTIYHPHSVLVHHEGRSHGRDTGSGIKAYQVINQRKFLERWGETLRLEHFPNAEDVFLARDRSAKKPRILIIDHYVPQWDRDAGSRTVFLYIKMFLEHGFAVTFWPDNLHEDREYTEPLQAMGVEVIYHPAYIGKFPTWIAENGKYFDYALLCRPHVTENYIDDIRATGSINIIYYGVDLHCKRLEASYELTGDKSLLVEAARWEALERSISGKSDIVLYPGYHEVEVVKTWVSKDVTVLNFPITIFNEQELADGWANLDSGQDRNPYNLMFVGGFTHHPNVGGVLWFIREVMPRLRRADARFNIRIAGSNAPVEITDLAGDGVHILGRVSDDELMDMYHQSAFAIVPLLYGAGVKGKVIEAMARGVPVVMTSVGAQGIEDAGDLAIVEDDPARMASLIIAAAVNRTDSIRKGRAAIDFIRRWYSDEAVTRLLAPSIPELSKGPQ